jgi:hypothetical protein
VNELTQRQVLRMASKDRCDCGAKDPAPPQEAAGPLEKSPEPSFDGSCFYRQRTRCTLCHKEHTFGVRLGPTWTFCGGEPC